MRCTALRLDGERCREQRTGWLWVVETGGRLRYFCTSHLPQDRQQGQKMVTAAAMRDFFVSGADPAA